MDSFIILIIIYFILLLLNILRKNTASAFGISGMIFLMNAIFGMPTFTGFIVVNIFLFFMLFSKPGKRSGGGSADSDIDDGDSHWSSYDSGGDSGGDGGGGD